MKRILFCSLLITAPYCSASPENIEKFKKAGLLAETAEENCKELGGDKKHLKKIRTTGECVDCNLRCLPNIKEAIEDFQRKSNKPLNFEGAQFAYADLENANLEGANLSGAEIVYSDLTHTNFKNAHLQSIDFSMCHFNKTNFTNARLNNALFFIPSPEITKSIFTGAILKNAKIGNGLNGYMDFFEYLQKKCQPAES